MGNSRSDFEFGKVEYLCPDQRGENGSSASPVTLTLVAHGDEELLALNGIRELRHARILRLTAEAASQGVLLNYLDLSALLLTSLATLKRDISCLEAGGAAIMLRGRRKNPRKTDAASAADGMESCCLSCGEGDI